MDKAGLCDVGVNGIGKSAHHTTHQHERETMRPLIIWLHGLGDTGRGWAHLPRELRLGPQVSFSFPDAPQQPVTCNGGYVMTSWMVRARLLPPQHDSPALA